MSHLDPLILSFAGHADIGHLCLLAWALASSWMAAHVLKSSEAANARFEGFVRELARFNSQFDPPPETGEAHGPNTQTARAAANSSS
jgi:hypothetical protein